MTAHDKQEIVLSASAEFIELAQFAFNISQQCGREGEDSLNDGILAWNAVISHRDFSTTNEEFQAIAYDEAADCYLQRYWEQKRPSDLDAAIQLWMQSVDKTPNEDTLLIERLNDLGLVLREKHLLTKHAEYLEKAMRVWRRALSLTHPESPEYYKLLCNLGIAHYDRYLRTQSVHDLNQAIVTWKRALNLMPDDASDLPVCANNLGNGLIDRYQQEGKKIDLDEAVTAYRQAVAHIDISHPERPGFLTNLGLALHERYVHTGREEDIEDAVPLLQEALELTPQDAPTLSGRLTNLGIGLQARYHQLRQDSDLERAIQVFRLAVERTSREDVAYPMYLNNLANGLLDYFLCCSDSTYLDEAIALEEEAVNLTPSHSLDLPIYLTSLGAGYRTRYVFRGDPADLDNAIKAYEKAAHCEFIVYRDRAAILNNLGAGYSDRYTLHGNIEDLNKAIQSWNEARIYLSPDSQELAPVLNNLSIGLRDRYLRLGQWGDLVQAIRLIREAIEITPSRSLDRVDYLNTLANALRTRYERTKQLNDLQDAIDAYEDAFQIISKESPELPVLLNNWATALSDRYLQTRQIRELRQAVKYWIRAIRLTTPNSPDVSGILNNLGTGFHDLFLHTKRSAYLLAAIKAWEKSVEKTPSNSPDLPHRLNNLASGYLAEYAQTYRPQDLEKALRTLRSGLACMPPRDFPERRRTLAYNLGNLYESQQHWPEARRAYEQAAQAANQLHLGSITQEAMKHLARQNADLYARLVHSCLKVGDETAALTHIFASQGRALADMIASHPLDMDALPPELRDRIGAILDLGERIRAIERQQPLGNVDKRTSLHATLERLRQQETDAWRALQRDYPEFFRLQAGDPLTLPQAQNLAGELDATLVGYYRHTGGWLAYVIPPHAGEPTLIPLDTLDDYHLSQLLRATYYRLDRRPQQTWRRLRDMYARLLAPLQAYLPAPDPSHPSKLVLVPFGPLHFLPLSAMILDDEALDGSRHLNEAYIVGIVPNLSVLRRMLEKAQTHSERNRLLAVAYSDPQGPLTLHRVDAEVRAVAAHFPSGSVPPLSEAEATTGRVIAAAPQAHVLHFACHGRFHPDPNQAGLRLADGWLRVLDIIYRLRLDQTSLVTLSACETGRVQVDAGDELAGLNLAFMHAGAAAVLASLWPVDDHATERLFHHFYTHYRAGRSVAASLSAAQRDLRREGFHHPFHWAAFQPMGMVF